MPAAVTGTARVTCPACGRANTARLVQSIDARAQPDAKAMLLAGELNLLACPCGARSQLAATLLYVDPDAAFTCQVVPGGEPDVELAAARFAAAGVTGTRRIVPSQNALVEKVKLVDAGLADWAIELCKVVLLATLATPGDAVLERVMLFDGVDRQAGRLHWLRFDTPARAEPVASPLVGYERLRARPGAQPAERETRIDRAWAVAAMQQLVTSIN